MDHCRILKSCYVSARKRIDCTLPSLEYLIISSYPVISIHTRLHVNAAATMLPCLNYVYLLLYRSRSHAASVLINIVLILSGMDATVQPAPYYETDSLIPNLILYLQHYILAEKSRLDPANKSS